MGGQAHSSPSRLRCLISSEAIQGGFNRSCQLPVMFIALAWPKFMVIVPAISAHLIRLFNIGLDKEHGNDDYKVNSIIFGDSDFILSLPPASCVCIHFVY